MYSGIQPEKRLEEMFLMYRVSVEVGVNVPGSAGHINPATLLGDPMGMMGSYSPYGGGKSNYSVAPYMMKGAGSSTNSALSVYGLSGGMSGLGSSYTTASAQYSGGKGGGGKGSGSAGGGK